jgi:hypothetical protein
MEPDADIASPGGKPLAEYAIPLKRNPESRAV